ncbi:MAG: D-2-hydroxyacid dehydrogenase [Lachnospiraceae bacterium]|nr:D-2-hydroxyacid dehydrogenase [Lachnospiraceae bacterium]
MATINVYEQYFAADLTASGVPRKGALVMLVSDSGGGMIKYEAAVTFFPHRNEEDFAVSYDAYYSKVLYEAAGRRSKQKEASFLKEFQETIDGLAKEAGGKVFWDKPLREARTDGGQLPEIKLDKSPAAEAGGSKKKESPEGKTERKLITAVHELNAEQRDRIRDAAQAAGLSCRFFESPEEALPEAGDAEVIFAHGISLIGSAPQLKWLATPFAGVDPYTKPGVFASPDAVLTNSSGAYGTTIAEHVVQVSLSMLRQDPVYRESIREKKWTRAVPIRSLRDSRIVLLGTGDIGQEVAHRMKAFYPASLTGVNRSGKHPGGDFDQVVPLSGLDALLPETDLLVLSLPNTPETFRLLDTRRLKLLPDEALIVNVGRGTVIDQAALEKELRAGRLYAALDVFEEEPIPADATLWDCPRLFITPHTAGNLSLPYTVEKVTQLFLENLERYGKGEPLLRQIDLKKGY